MVHLYIAEICYYDCVARIVLNIRGSVSDAPSLGFPVHPTLVT